MEITAQMVKQLREETGAAFLDCKNALVEHEGDIEKATEFLRKKGLATAAKKADRVASEGLIETYTHTGGQVGVMVEVNCETDFVARTPQFQEFAHDLTLHIAFHDPKFIAVEDVPEEVVKAKSDLLRRQAIDEGKPETVVERIVEGRMGKWYEEIVLLAQPWIKDEKGEKSVQDIITELIVELKENIVVGRIARFEIGQADDDEAEA